MTGTGDCFIVAAKLQAELRDLTLCHGMVTGTAGTPAAGKRFWHAWCEKAGYVLDRSNGNNVVIRAEEYYLAGRIDAVHRYTRIETATLLINSGHWGPWSHVPPTEEQP